MNTDDERIAQRAYRIWEEAGRPEGQSLEHWFMAEAELGSTTQGDAAPRSDDPATPSAGGEPGEAASDREHARAPKPGRRRSAT